MLYRLKRFVLRLLGITYTISRRAEVQNSKWGEFVNIAKGAYVISSDIGAYSSIGRNTSIINCRMGKFCSISWNVTVGATAHNFNHLSTHSFPYIEQFGFAKGNKRIVQEVKLGHDVWIGANAIIMPGLTVGNGAIIGAGAVVTKDIPPYAICAGVPAKIIKFRFESDMVEKIESLEWWHWSKEKIAANIQYFKKPLEPGDLKKF